MPDTPMQTTTLTVPPLKNNQPKSERAGMWEILPKAPTEPGYVRAEDLPPGALIG